MKYNTLEIKNYRYINYGELVLIKKQQGYEITDYVKFTELELKSLLSWAFAYHLHLTETSQYNNQPNTFNSDANVFFKISLDFGRSLLENLDSYRKDWFNELLQKEYKIQGIVHNENILSFVEEGLIDLMNVIEWEYGRFFLQKLFLIISDNSIWEREEKNILNALKNKEDYMSIMAKKIKDTNTFLNSREEFILIFVLKEKILKEEMTMYDYTVISQIAQQKMYLLHSRRNDLKLSFNKYLKQNWNLNRGMGGPKR